MLKKRQRKIKREIWASIEVKNCHMKGEMGVGNRVQRARTSEMRAASTARNQRELPRGQKEVEK